MIITDNRYTQAIPQFDEINDALAARVKPLLDDGSVPVMGGFIGATKEYATTIGRGGSDFTAAIVGAALDASASRSGPTWTA